MSRGKILIIEDEFLNVLELKQLLKAKQKFGEGASISEADIVSCRNHDLADEWLAEHPNECALIISDNMTGNQGGKTGVQWVEELRLKPALCDIPVFFISGSLTDEIRSRLETAGVDKEHVGGKPYEKKFVEKIVDAYERLQNSRGESDQDRVLEAPVSSRIR